MLQKLTKEQQQLVEESIPLVRWYLKTKLQYIPNGEYDDFFQMGVYGLCKAAATFSTGNGTRFSTYAYFCIANEILMHLRKERRRGAERNALRLEATVPGHMQGDDTLADHIPALENVESAMRLIELKQILRTRAKERNGKIMILYMKGHNQTAIVRRFNISQPAVSRYIRQESSAIAKAIGRKA